MHSDGDKQNKKGTTVAPTGADSLLPSRGIASDIGVASSEMQSANLASLFSLAYQDLVTSPNQTAREVLERYTDLDAHSKYAIELIYEEYCRDVAERPEMSTAGFLERYADYASQLRRLISVHQEIASPEILDRLDEIAWPAIGEIHGDFELTERLGRGAFSTVYLARQKSVDERHVVIKFTANSQGEVAALSRLTHANIVPIYTVDHFADLGLNAICMPYVGRNTLFDVLQLAFKESPPEDIGELRLFLHSDPIASESEFQAVRKAWRCPFASWVVEKGIQLLDALDYSHSRGVLHCDLKPSNVLIDAHADAHLIDFNLAQHQGEGRRGGTLPYMSPEQLRELASVDGDREITAKTDLFGWGVMIGQLLTGELPFQSGDNLASVSPGHAEEARRQLKVQVSGLPDHWGQDLPLPTEVLALIRSTLAFDPANRPSSAAALASQLRAGFAEVGAGLSQQESNSQAKSTRRSRIVAGSLLLAGAASVALFPFLPTSRKPDQGESSALSSRGDSQVDPNSSAPTVELPTHELAFQLFERDSTREAILEYFEDGIPDPNKLSADEHFEVSFIQASELIRKQRPPSISASMGNWYSSGRSKLTSGKFTDSDVLILAINDSIVRLEEMIDSSSDVNERTYRPLERMLNEDHVDERCLSSFHHVRAMMHLSRSVRLPHLRRSLAPNQPTDLDLARMHIDEAIAANPKFNDVYLDRALIMLTETMARMSSHPAELEVGLKLAESDLEMCDHVIEAESLSQMRHLIELARTASDLEASRQAMQSLTAMIRDVDRRWTNRLVFPPRFAQLRDPERVALR